jgi:hypothetical protein
MPPQVKATLTLPFAIAVIAGAVIVLTSHPAIFIWGLMGISSVAITWVPVVLSFCDVWR